MQSPYPWIGGKGRLAQEILTRIPPPHRDRTYVEPFFGGGAVYFAQRPSGVEVINDLNSEVIHFFRVLRDRESFDALLWFLQSTPYSREMFYAWRKVDPASLPDINRAARFFYIARSAFAGQSTGRTPSWAFARSTDNRARSLAAVVDHDLIHVRDRLRNTLIEHDDAIKVIQRYDSPSAVIYCDPPYVQGTRSDGGYQDEMDDYDHERLLRVLKGSEGFVALSGYPSELYRDVLESEPGWSFVDFDMLCRANQSTQVSDEIDRQRTERLWMNHRLTEWVAQKKNSQASIFDLLDVGGA
ncbi:DNA adenine methylase [Acidithiobacillus montserratensis]|uniref:DNA adenine methylase n=1 Tax=Acidithiobacillus montserratensis TaxID=2729135 RepID=A0ACD5HJG3_9PROT|nr:DNA adenine methylase [Acidithiobacillus montserratensis]MBU2748634.1 DNA adenine methylase [Acidithiobacillus montserratensis]